MTKTSKDQAGSSVNLTSNVKSWMSGNNYNDLKDYLTPLTRHVPRVFELVDQLIKDKLPESTFPVLPTSIPAMERPKEIVVFILNGATYEEARFINYLNGIRPNVKIVLGSNFIHNNRRYHKVRVMIFSFPFPV